MSPSRTTRPCWTSTRRDGPLPRSERTWESPGQRSASPLRASRPRGWFTARSSTGPSSPRCSRSSPISFPPLRPQTNLSRASHGLLDSSVRGALRREPPSGVGARRCADEGDSNPATASRAPPKHRSTRPSEASCAPGFPRRHPWGARSRGRPRCGRDQASLWTSAAPRAVRATRHQQSNGGSSQRAVWSSWSGTSREVLTSAPSERCWPGSARSRGRPYSVFKNSSRSARSLSDSVVPYSWPMARLPGVSVEKW